MLDGRSWRVAEVPQDQDAVFVGSMSRGGGSSLEVTSTTAVVRPNPPAIVTQHLQIDRQFVVINSKVFLCYWLLVDDRLLGHHELRHCCCCMFPGALT